MPPQAIVTTDQGSVRGKTESDDYGENYFSFYGIPYAKPPEGNLRFKDPQPPEPWTGIRNATNEAPPCLANQAMLGGDITIQPTGSENCLTLNIYTPKLYKNDQELKPVMVFIHGGAFVSGSNSPSMAGPQYLMTENVVMVSIQYRLGALGFLSLDSLGIGNAGLKDMVMALKWIQNNIKSFGGNPNSVTIYGISAGGAAVHYLVLSHLAKGLFHKAIAQSGSVFNFWAWGANNNAIPLARELGCTEEDPAKILEFLQQIPAEEIVKIEMGMQDISTPSLQRIFGPVIEKSSQTALISEDPLKLIKDNKCNQVPIMMGFCASEGIFNLMFTPFGEKTNWVPFMLSDYLKPDKLDYITKKIHQYYFHDDEENANNLEAKTKIATDTYFLRGINTAVQAHARASSKPVYYYRFDIETELNLIKQSLINLAPVVLPKGPTHIDDCGYLMPGNMAPEIVPDSPEDIGRKRMLRLWTNFARYGNPTHALDRYLQVEWKPATKKELNYLNIGSELTPGTNPEQDRMKLWDEIYSFVPDAPY